MTGWRRAIAMLGVTVAATAMMAVTTAGPATAGPATTQDQAPAATATATASEPTFHPATGTEDVVINATLTFKYHGFWAHGSSIVDIWWGFFYNPDVNNLRAWALMSGNSSSIHVQAEPLNLGNRQGVLASRVANSQVGHLEVTTPLVKCRPLVFYRSNLHYSIRWPDGTLTSNKQTGQFERRGSTICF